VSRCRRSRHWSGTSCQERVDHRHGDVGSACAQSWAAIVDVVLVKKVGCLRTQAARLRKHSGNDATVRPLQEIPDKGAADAEAHHQKLVDLQMIHRAELIVSLSILGALAFERSRGLAAIGVT